ncbi:unnamed protein product, partial [Gulo gulo]
CRISFNPHNSLGVDPYYHGCAAAGATLESGKHLRFATRRPEFQCGLLSLSCVMESLSQQVLMITCG